MRDHLYAEFHSFFTLLLRQQFSHDAVIAAMQRFGVDVCADRWTSSACKRVSRCFGLPLDGHVVHTLQQGRVRFLGAGPNANLKVVVSASCQSKWDLAAHRGGVWLLAHSSLGKDNALAVHHAIVAKLKGACPGLVCFNELEVGRLTFAGLLEDVAGGKSPDGSTHWLSWTNSEMSQCFRGGSHDVGEKDFCQLAEGAPIGKRILGKKEAKRVHFWFAIGAHPKALKEYFGASENGRLRGFAAYINKREVMRVSLQTKLTDHEDSLAWLASMQEEVVKMQHIGDMRVQSVRFLPEALIVLEALHEAARDVIGEVDDEVAGEESGVAAAIWPAIVKFVG